MNWQQWPDTALITVSGVTITPYTLALASLSLLLGITISRRLRNLIRHHLGPRFHMNPSTAFALSVVTFYIGVALSLGLAVSLLGFDLSNIVIVAGALSVGIGLGLQAIANNFVSGLILLFDRSIKVGDYVQLASGLRGTITQIRVRSTIIMSNDGLEVIVPNSQFISDQVINWTLSDNFHRLHVPFGVAYGSDVEQVVDVVLAAARELPFVVREDPDHAPDVWFTAMGNSSLDFELLVWIYGAAVMKPSGSRSKTMFAVHRVLVEAGIQIPFPQRDLHLKTVSENIRFGEK